jgi:Rieske Fe-S protein
MPPKSNRREMLKTSALVAGAVCTCDVLTAFAAKSDCCNTPDLEPESYYVKKDRIELYLTKTAFLSDSGHAAILSYPERKIELILIRPDKDKYLAFQRFCTHGWQTLSYNKHRRLIQCNNFNHALFDLDGKVWKGPAPDPLPTFKTEKTQQTLVIFI